MPAASKPLHVVADKRTPWGGISGNADIVVLGVDWSDATFKLQIRAEPGDSGDPIVELANASAGAEGISAQYVTAYSVPDSDEVVAATIIRPQIDEATLEALALAADTAKLMQMHYDIHATVTGIGKFVMVAGIFSIAPGVTI